MSTFQNFEEKDKLNYHIASTIRESEGKILERLAQERKISRHKLFREIIQDFLKTEPEVKIELKTL